MKSPDKGSLFEISTRGGLMTYRFLYHGFTAVNWSGLGFEVNGVNTSLKPSVLNVSRRTVDSTFNWHLGENQYIKDYYNQLLLECDAGSLKYNIIIRVFNGCAAFRFQVRGQAAHSRFEVGRELTEFNLTSGALLYQYNQESVYTPTVIDTLSKTSDFPTTVVTQSKLFLSIGEADNYNFGKGELCKASKPGVLGITFRTDSVKRGDKVLRRNDTVMRFTGSFFTPWRTISCSETAVGLHNYSDLNLRLSGVSAKSTIAGNLQPGKLIRSQLNTQSGLESVDFAATHNFQYVLFDAGWYGAEFRTTSDPATVIPQLDLQRIIDYGKSKKIGIILYVNYVGLKAGLDKLLPVYKKWGVSGLKFGFVDGLSQKGISWLDTAIRKVNDYGFVLDIHDNYKPTGLSKKYPYLLTQEGVRGDENSPDAFHTTVLPFTRFLAGPADFTFCFPNPHNQFTKNLKVSKAQQLALTVVFFSPLQSIFWYGNAKDYSNEDEIEFFKYVPTVWDETKYLAGSIGENISVARKKSGIWYIGNVAGLSDWNTSLKLDFLDKHKNYHATVYEDDGSNGIHKRVIKLKAGSLFPVGISAKSGQAVIIRPD